MNLRHASNELNWQVEDWCEPALLLKRSIVRYFDRLNIRTYRLCFGIKMRSNSGIWGSIVLRETIGERGESYFDISHTEDFNANSRVLIPYKQRVAKNALPKTLRRLCDYFYDSKAGNGEMPADRSLTRLPAVLPPAHRRKPDHRCLSNGRTETVDAEAPLRKPRVNG